MKSERLALFLVLLAFVTACGGGGGAPSTLPSTQPTPTPTPVSSASAVIGVPTSGSLATSAPVPSSYAANASLTIGNASTGTSLAVTGSLTPPTGIPLYKTRARTAAAASSAGASIYFSVTPSSQVSIAGPASASVTFPTGALSASTQYYLAFYDPTTTSPSWQTIAGPVAPVGSALSFSGTVLGYVLQPNVTYGLAIYDVANGTPPPSPAPADLLYVLGSTNGSAVSVYTAGGTLVQTFGQDPRPAPRRIVMDGAGDVFLSTFGTGENSGSINRFAIGASAPSATIPEDIWFDGTYGNASGTIVNQSTQMENSFEQNYDVIDPGSAGPNRGFEFGETACDNRFPSLAAVGADGSVAITYDTSVCANFPNFTVTRNVSVYPPQSTTAENTFAYATAIGSAPAISATALGLGPDDTAYVGTPSTMYVYPLTANPTQLSVSNPSSIGFDGVGNVYVLDDNGLTVYTPEGAAMVRNVSAGITSGTRMTVSPEGTAYIQTSAGIVFVGPSDTSATLIVPGVFSDFAVYDGVHAANARKPRAR